MDEPAEVQCPYCFEWLELWLDPDTEGQFVQDCDVCCRPWQVHVSRDPLTGEVSAMVGRLDD